MPWFVWRVTIAVITSLQLIGCSTTPVEHTARQPLRGNGYVEQARDTLGSPARSADRKTNQQIALYDPEPTGNDAQLIGTRDTLEVSVFKIPELTRTVQVTSIGTINLPLVGEIAAAGRTARDVERDVTKRLAADYLRSPQVTVLVKEYNSQRVTVEGAVRSPGVYPIKNGKSLLQLIAMANGLSEASDATVTVFRQAEGSRGAARFDIKRIRAGTEDDPELLAGDVVVAGESTLKNGLNSFLKVLPIVGTFALL